MSESSKARRAPVGFWRWVWRLTAGLFAALVLFLALGVGMFRVLVPMFPDYQQRIEAIATRALGHPFEFSEVDARWRLRGPELLFSNVKLRNANDARTLLEARRCRVALDVWSLLKGGAMQPALVTINDTDIALKRDTDGAWFVQGESLDQLRGESRASQEPWGLADGALELRNVRLNIDDQLLQRRIAITDLDLEVDVNANRLRLKGEVQLGESAKERVQFSLDADGRADNLQAVSWQALFRSDALNLKQWQSMFPADWQVDSKQPAQFSVWLDAQGHEVNEATLDLELKEFVLPDSVTQLDRLQGQFAWEKTSSGWQLQGQDLALEQVDSVKQTFTANLTFSHIAQNDQWSFSANYLPIGEITTLVSALPINTRTDNLRAYSPQGLLRDVEGFVAVRDTELVDFGLTAQADNLALSSVDGSPAFTGLNARIFGGYEQGGAHLLSDGGSIELPGVLRESIPLHALSANVAWSRTDTEHRIRLSDINVSNPDLTVAGQVDLQKPLSSRVQTDLASASTEGEQEEGNEQPAAPGNVVQEAEPWRAQMSLTVENLVLKEAKKYYPVNRIKPKTLAWLDQALISGTGSQGVFSLDGPLNKFPFVDPADGDFSASIELNDATLSYHADWPIAEALNARMEFDRDAISSTVTSARLRTVDLANAQVTMPSLKKPQILLEADVAAPLDDMRAYIDATPLVTALGQTWADSQFYGQGVGQLALDLNLVDRQATVYSVALQVSDTEVIYKDWQQRITGLQGAIRLTEQSLVSDYADGVLMGAPVKIELSASNDPDVLSEISLHGVTTDELLATHLSPKLREFFSGSAAWTAQAKMRRRGTEAQPFEVRIQSPLEGMSVLLPSPLGKQNLSETRFLDTTLTVSAPGEMLTTIDYGNTTSAIAAWLEQGGRWRAQAGELRFGGGAATMPESSNVRIVGTVDKLDLTEVIEFVNAHPSDDPWITLDEASLSVTALTGLDQPFGATNLLLERLPAEYRVRFTGERLDGEVVVPEQHSPTTPIVAKLSNLIWQSQPDSQQDIDPRNIPSIELSADNFRYNEYELGAMSMHLEARDSLVAVREFATTTNHLTTRTTGSWLFSPTESTTFLVTEVASSNVRGALKAMNQADFIEANEARARIELSWPQGWSADYLNTVEGEISMSVGPGKINSVDPGAGRVFGLLSVGALPRRLSLDFRDVFGSGFGFDGISGDFILKDGDAVTENLALRGPAANVVITGRAGLEAQDYDQLAYVYANFGSTLPIAGAIAGGPAVGAALFVFSEIFKRPLRQMGQVTYSIRGSWDDPKIERLSASRPQPGSESEAPADTELLDEAQNTGSGPAEVNPGTDRTGQIPEKGGQSNQATGGSGASEDVHSLGAPVDLLTQQ